MEEALQIMLRPFLVCSILTGIHTYLGIHVLGREVIFVDLALAQIAALGATVGFIVGYPLDSTGAYLFSLTFTLLGAGIFALTRFDERSFSQEAVIGITYAMAAAAVILILDRAPQGAEHLRYLLVGNVLAVRWPEIVKTFAAYLLIGLFHWGFRRQFLLLTFTPKEAIGLGINPRLWDFLFYASFGLVVTSSVRIAGVLLVFTYLIVPAFAAMLLVQGVGNRLLLGWALGLVGSLLGLSLSYWLDLPTGAAVVCTFGALLILALFWRRYGTTRG
ncbi:MAG: metal ABC transporter permease [Candidatus Methylomirabilales bacterium]